MRRWINMIAECGYEWFHKTEDDLREFARQFVGWATNEMGDPDQLSFRLYEQFPLADLEHCFEGEWEDYYDTDVEPLGEYDGLIDEDFHTPIVVSIENGEVILWDGYHRVATAFKRGDEVICAIVGRPR